jgi:hypothetical protein
MTRARDNSFNPFNNQVAGKNLCINGGFDHWQRGNSFGSSNSVYVFTADRWEIVRHGYQLGMTVSRQTAGLDGFRYCARIQRDSGNTSTNNLQFQTSFETSEVLPFINKTMTISFYARKSSTASSSSLSVQIISGTGTDQAMKNYTGGTVSFQQTSTLTDSWQRFSFSGSVLSPYTEFGIWFGYTPSGTAGAADYVEITGVQLELGSSATQFSRAGGTIGGELASCQRYFQALSWGPTYNTAIHSGHFWSSTKSLGTVHLKTTMRGTPAVSISSPSHVTVYSANATYSVSSIGVDATTPASFDIEFVTSSAGTAGYGTFNRITNSSGYLWISAEL